MSSQLSAAQVKTLATQQLKQLKRQAAVARAHVPLGPVFFKPVSAPKLMAAKMCTKHQIPQFLN